MFTSSETASTYEMVYRVKPDSELDQHYRWIPDGIENCVVEQLFDDLLAESVYLPNTSTTNTTTVRYDTRETIGFTPPSFSACELK